MIDTLNIIREIYDCSDNYDYSLKYDSKGRVFILFKNNTSEYFISNLISLLNEKYDISLNFFIFNKSKLLNILNFLEEQKIRDIEFKKVNNSMSICFNEYGMYIDSEEYKTLLKILKNSDYSLNEFIIQNKIK